jgi:oxygen-independent coproporphyrinogen-3 oxidase
MTGLYIHIPFCVKKCAYCDFISYTGYENQVFNQYSEALCTELKIREDILSKGISTIYIGGGTPSLLSPLHIEKIFSSINKISPLLSPDIEISIEVNPATADITKLKDFKQLGINRISLGVQTFNNNILTKLGRIHSSEDILKTYKECRQADFKNISIDLMFALPGQTIELWKQDLQKAISMELQHYSIYNLQIEEGTPFWEEKEKGSLNLPSEDQDADMYIYAVEFLLKQKFYRYEISNFAIIGMECKHNVNYWENGNYIGVGVAAHSHFNGKRWANTTSLKDYLATPSKSIVEYTEGSTLSIKEETIFLGLRMSKGVDKKNFIGYEKQVNKLIQNHLLEETGTRYRLTSQGILLANRVLSEFI